jgi:hypothetical protein
VLLEAEVRMLGEAASGARMSAGQRSDAGNAND